MAVAISLGVFERNIVRSCCRAFSCSKLQNYGSARVMYAPVTPYKTPLAPLPEDYGKYYEPRMWEGAYQWFVDTTLVRSVESGLVMVHDTTGLPWWATILVCTVALRATITSPLFIWQMHKMSKYHALMPVIEELSRRLNKEGDKVAKEFKWDERTRNMKVYTSFVQHKTALFKKNKVPGTLRRYLLPWVQIPIWMSMTAALRHMTLSLPFVTSYTLSQTQTMLEFSQEGTLWFSNLCVADPYYILPVLMCLFNLSVIEVHRGDGKTPLVAMQRVIVNVLRGISIFMIPIACYMPSGVTFYWFISSGFGLFQALAFQSIRFKKLLRLPVSEYHSKTPYKDILSRFKISKSSKSIDNLNNNNK